MQYIITISHKQHKIIKLYHPQKRFLCQKIIIYKKDDTYFILRLQKQLENIKNYFQHRYRFKSQFQMTEQLAIQIHQQFDCDVFYITVKYNQYPTLAQFLRKQSFGLMQDIPFNQKMGNLFTFFVEELFETLMRGGGIDNYIYSPNNIFIIPKSMRNNFETIKLFINPISMVGLKVFNSNQNIDIQDLQEIYPCLPPNLYEITSMMELNVLIKKRCFAFILLCWIIKSIPNLVDSEKLSKSVSQRGIKQLLHGQRQIYRVLLYAYDDELIKAEILIGIKLRELFNRILVQNCKDLTWSNIYEMVFLSQQRKDRGMIRDRVQFQKIVQGEWELQKDKQFYRSRQISPQNKEVGQSMIFLLTKLNISFHLSLRYPDLVQQLKGEYFSQTQNELLLSLIKSGGVENELMQFSKEQFDINRKFNSNLMNETKVKMPHPIASQNALDIFGTGMIYKCKSSKILIADQKLSIFDSSNYW